MMSIRLMGAPKSDQERAGVEAERNVAGGFDHLVWPPCQELATAGFGLYMTVFHHHFTTAQSGYRPPGYLHPFIRGVVDNVLHRIVADRNTLFCVPKHDISVGTGGDGAFAWIQAEQASRIGRCQAHESAGVDAAFGYTLAEQDWQAGA